MLKNEFLILILILLLNLGCRSVSVSPGFEPTRAKLARDGFGSFIILTLNNGSIPTGELIAVTPDTVFVLVGEKVVPFPGSSVRSARVVIFRNKAGAYGAITFLLCLGTLTNGMFLIGTLPLNLIAGIAVASSENRYRNYIDYSDTDTGLSKYARFPQGIPEGVNLSEIHPRSKNK